MKGRISLMASLAILALASVDLGSHVIQESTRIKPRQKPKLSRSEMTDIQRHNADIEADRRERLARRGKSHCR